MLSENSFWAVLGPSTGNIVFCEGRVDGGIAEPANAWSSLAYVAAGLWILARQRKGGGGPLLLAGATGLAIGAGSFALHATETFVGQILDDGSMFLLSCLTLTLALRRLLRWDMARCRAFYLALVMASTASLLRFHGSGALVFGIEMATAGTAEVLLWYRGEEGARYRALLATLLTLGGAIVVWKLDLRGVGCGGSTEHLVNGHAVWHVLTAVSIATYCHYQEQFHPSRLAAGPHAVVHGGVRPACAAPRVLEGASA